jgi:hypothetical protein
MIQSEAVLNRKVQMGFMLTQQAREYIRIWQFQQPQSTVRTSKEEAQLLLRCSITKTWPNIQQGVSNRYYIFRVRLQPYWYIMPSTCTILHYHMWPIWLHIFPHCFTKPQFSETCKHKTCNDFLYRKKCSIRMDRQNETNDCFLQILQKCLTVTTHTFHKSSQVKVKITP